jgi:hypothetical protein
VVILEKLNPMNAMRRSRWIAALAIVALSLAGCGGDSGEKAQDAPSSITPTASGNPLEAGGLSLDAGSGLSPALNVGGLPGCSDPDDEACPMPLVMDLDGEIVAGGIGLRYPARYFNVTVGEGDIPLTITPSENNRFEERAVFEAYFAGSVEAALAGLSEPEVADWTAAGLSGKIGVSRDQTQDPPVNTTVGAFALADGRAVVLKLTTTGKYGWDLWSQVYAAMLETLTVTS